MITKVDTSNYVRAEGQKHGSARISWLSKTEMSLTIQQIISDAKRLASRLKEHDSAADALLSQTQSVYKQIESMKQYQEDVTELNDVARQRPHSALAAGIQQENRNLRKLQQENRELRAALEEHQNALELIMSKYRQQTDTLIRQSQMDVTRMYRNSDIENLCRQSEKIAEMAAVMNHVASVDEESTIQNIECMSQLMTENRGLREMLLISKGSFNSLQQTAPQEENKGLGQQEIPVKLTPEEEHKGLMDLLE